MKKAIIPFCLLITIALAVFLFINRFVSYSTIEVDGYAFNSNAIFSNLSDAKNQEKITVEPVSAGDTIYKSSSKYYVGEEKKKNIVVDYPIISNDASTIYLSSNVGELISDDFGHETAYAGALITDAKLYNSNNYEQATNYSYYFVALNSGLFVNVAEINIKTYSDDIIIPVNSFILFKENAVSYYYLVNNEFVYKSYPLIDNNDKVIIENFAGSYKDLLVNLFLIKADKSDQISNNTLPDYLQNVTEDTNKHQDEEEELLEEEQQEIKIQEGTISGETAKSKPEYIRKDDMVVKDSPFITPVVMISDTYTKTYSYRGIINISDPSNAITKAPTLEFKIDGNTVLRKSISSSGSFKVPGLLPSTKYEVTASFQFINKDTQKKYDVGIKFDGSRIVDVVTTKSIDELNPLDLNLSGIGTSTNSFEIEKVLANNPVDDEILNGIKSITIKTKSINFAFTSSEIKNLTNLIEFTFTSPDTLKTNTKYDAEFEVVDTAGNILPVKNGKFSFKTKQSPPIAKIEQFDRDNADFRKAKFRISVSNPDNVDIQSNRYYVYNEDGSLVTSGNISPQQVEYVISGLDTARKYVLQVLSTYITDEGYTVTDYEIGNCPFVSYDVAKLGNIEFSVAMNPDKKVTDKTVDLIIKSKIVNKNPSMYNVLDDTFTMHIINAKTKSIVASKTGNKSDLANGIEYAIGYEDGKELKSNTEYEVIFEATVTSGKKVIQIKTSVEGGKFKFKTLKLKPYVSLSNIFIAAGYIDFDAVVVDPDGVIYDPENNQANDINLELSEKKAGDLGKKVGSITLPVQHTLDEEILNEAKQRVTFDSLEDGGNYIFNFIAPNYDDNYNIDTNVALEGSNEFILSGLSAKIDVQSMIKTINFKHEDGVNLFDLQDISRWKSDYAHGSNKGEDININNEGENDEKELVLNATYGWRVYSYYLPELIDQDVAMSFLAKRSTTRTQNVCIVNGVYNSSSLSYCVGGKALTINSDSFTAFNDITFKLNKSGYISIMVDATANQPYTNGIIFRKLTIQTGKTSKVDDFDIYPQGFGYRGDFSSTAKSIGDAKESNPGLDINNGSYEYLITLSNTRNDTEDNRKVQPFKLGDAGEEGFKTENGITDDDLHIDGILEDTSYYVSFSIHNMDTGVYYNLDRVDFQSDAEIRVIRNRSDFINMHRRGYYIAVNDLNFIGTSTTYGGVFNGILDMQGHTIKINSASGTRRLFSTIGGGGVLKNAVVEIDLDNTSPITDFSGLFWENYGNVNNVMVILKKSKKARNYWMSFFGWKNFGIIENFVVKVEQNLTGFREMTLGTRNNYGIMRNGYFYALKAEDDTSDGEPYGINSDYYYPEEETGGSKNVGIMTVNSSSGSILENVYSSLTVDIGPNPLAARDRTVGNVAASVSGATIRNVLVYDKTSPVGSGRDTNKDIMFNSVSGINYSNLYAISVMNYKKTYSKEQQVTALKNEKFMSNLLNSRNMFDTDTAWRLSIFPILKWPKCMPKQDYIDLPTMTSEDLKFLAVDKVIYKVPNGKCDDCLAQATITFYNPKGLNIKDVTIDNINELEVAGVGTNSDQITSVIVNIKGVANDYYRSKYILRGVRTTTGTISYSDELAIDLYKEVGSLETMLSGDPSTNYKLTRDINCNERTCVPLSTFKGKLDGNNHTISNMVTDACFINTLQGTLKDINFVNFTTTGKKERSGLICTLNSNGVIDNVFVENATLSAKSPTKNGNAYVGGLAGVVDNGSILRSAVNKVTLIGDDIAESMPNVGGLVGRGTNTIIETSLARNVNYSFFAVPGNNAGAGGIVGVLTSGKITNVYSTGKIVGNINYMGGIVGLMTSDTSIVNGSISKLDLEGKQDYIGGIVGKTQAKHAISQSLVLNNLSTTKTDASFFDRTSGTSISKSRNFGWDRQAINNVVNNNTKGEELLSQDNLRNPVTYKAKIGFNENWYAEEPILDDYCREDFTKDCVETKYGDTDYAIRDSLKSDVAYFPYLVYYTDDVMHVVKGQGYKTATKKSDIEDLRIKYELLFKLQEINVIQKNYMSGHEDDSRFIESYDLEFVFLNNKQYRITNLRIPDIKIDTDEYGIQDLQVVNNANEKTTKITVNIKPGKHYDGYVLRDMTYEVPVDGGIENRVETIDAMLDLPFYGIIDEPSDWAAIERNKYENYLLVTDVDLKDLTPLEIQNKSFNKLIGVNKSNGEMPKLSISDKNTFVTTGEGVSLIDTLVTLVTNINFDKVYFTNNIASARNYGGIIKFLNGKMNHVKFTHVEINAKNVSYCGIVALNQAPLVDDVLVQDAYIYGRTYVGTIGYSVVLPIAGITLDDVRIDSTGNYIGGIYGYEPWRSTGVFSSFLVANNIKINKDKHNTSTNISTSTSNQVGGLFGYGSGIEVLVMNSYISGQDYVGGIFGQPSQYYPQLEFSYNNEIHGRDTVGGLGGNFGYFNYGISFQNSIYGRYNVGGIAGYLGSRYVYRSYMYGGSVEGTERVGGVVGRMSWSTVETTTVNGTNVTGNKNVGGICGYVDMSDNSIRYSATNANVKAKAEIAGGIAGYNNNSTTRTDRYRFRIYNNIIGGSKVVATNNYVGGLIGKTEVDWFENQMYNNFIDAALETAGANGGYINGYNDNQSEKQNNTYVFEGTVLKKGGGNPVLYKNSQLENVGMFTKANAGTQSYYSGKISGYVFSDANGYSIGAGYYPRPNSGFRNSTITSNLNQVLDISPIHLTFDGNTELINMDVKNFGYLPLPKTDSRLGLLSGSNAGVMLIAGTGSVYHEVPEAKVYVSSPDTVNIEFEDVDTDSILIINEDRYYLDDRTMTFKYNFVDDFKFTVTDGIHNRVYEFKPEELRNSMLTIDNYYYLIKDGKLHTNDTNVIVENPVNISGKNILLADGSIYSLDTYSIVYGTVDNYSKVEKIPLYEFDYLGEHIETFYNYALVNDEYYPGQLFVQGEDIEIIDENLKNKKDRIIIDSYNNKKYLLYLGEDGILYSLKENINFPKNFQNVNIKDINCNLGFNTNLLFVLYEDGNYVVFNYKTGSLITDDFDYKPSLLEYISTKFTETVSSTDLDKPVDDSYREAVELISILEETPIDDVLNAKEENISRDKIERSSEGVKAPYTVKYDPEKKKYKVYELKRTEYNNMDDSYISDNSMIVTQISNPPVDEVIKNSDKLTKYYNIESNYGVREVSNPLTISIIAIIGTIITILIGLLGDLVIKKIKVRSNA